MVKLHTPYPKGEAVARTASSAIRDLLEITERPEVISLAGGLPAPDAFPVAAVERAASAVLAGQAPAALQYGATEGYRPLRAWVAGCHGAEIDQVLVTHGSQQALDLLARATCSTGDTIALADPGYVGAIQAFRAAGAHLHGVPGDADGLRTDLLAQRLAAGLRPTLVYVVANFDNPTGSTVAEGRRVELAALADRYGFVVVEDDPYGELRWRGPTFTPLRDLTERCVSLGTASKILSPGLRVGWAVAPVEIARNMVVLKQSSDLHTSTFAQHLVHHVLTEPGFLPAHLAGLRVRYRAQADALVGALRAELPDRFTFAEPDGGMFVWGRLTSGGDAAALLARAIDHGVAFVPGAEFAVDAAHRDELRLSFANGSAPELREGVRRLREAMDAG